MPRRRRIGSGALKGAGLLALGAVLAVTMQWSIASNLSGAPFDAADRMLQSWQVAWGGHALATDPSGIFDTNTFYPLDNDLAFTDGLIGYAPAGLVGSGPAAALTRYNLLVLFSYALAFVGAALLARELGLSWPAGLVAGTAFAYAPFRLAHYNHLHVLSSGAIPLALFLLYRGYRRGSPGAVLAGWVVAAWQVSIGFTLGLQLAYLLGLLAAVWAIRWLHAGRPPLPKAMIGASVGGMAIFGGYSIWQALPYLRVLEQYPEAHRIKEAVMFYSPPPASLLAAAPQSATWGAATESVRAGLDWVPEMTLFPGVTVVVLAAIGLATPALPRSRRLLLGGLAASVTVLAMGYSLPGGRQVYDLLYEWLPGWQASRTPSRLFTITTLALGLLAGAGAHYAGERFSTGSEAVSPAAMAAVCAVLMAPILIEGRQHLPIAPVQVPQGRVAVAEPQLHLPSDQFNDPYYVFLTTAGFPNIVNGYSGFVPNSYQAIRREMESFPSPSSVDRLRELGVRSVVVHLDRTPGTAWEGIAERPVAGLALSSRTEPGVIFYRIGDQSDQSR